MPYYHMEIIKKVDGKKRHFISCNLTKKKLMEVAKSYSENVRFVHSGRVYEPSSIDKITLFKSDERYGKLVLPDGKSPIGKSARVVASYFKKKAVAGVSIVTNQFIKSPPREKSIEGAKKLIDKRNVFIVHGRDHEPMKELKTMLREFGLNPIVLHEQSGGALTLVEKLEKYARGAGYAFVILTPEDVGGHKDEMRKKLGASEPWFKRPVVSMGANIMDDVLEDFEPRARQNVIFEMGYFFALLGRKNVCCLLKGKMEKPTDIDGVEYGHFNSSVNEVKKKIIRELRDAGYEIKSEPKELIRMRKSELI